MTPFFPNRGYYRGNLDALVKDSIAAFDRLPPEEQAKHRELQKKSWVKGELGIGDDKAEAEARADYRATQATELGKPTIPDPVLDAITARTQGFTGDQCTNCFSMKMVQTGHCVTCQNCGNTTACA